jgi:hypothetical protein
VVGKRREGVFLDYVNELMRKMWSIEAEEKVWMR